MNVHPYRFRSLNPSVIRRSRWHSRHWIAVYEQLDHRVRSHWPVAVTGDKMALWSVCVCVSSAASAVAAAALTRPIQGGTRRQLRPIQHVSGAAGSALGSESRALWDSPGPALRPTEPPRRPSGREVIPGPHREMASVAGHPGLQSKAGIL